jgi:hypothetical protein
MNHRNLFLGPILGFIMILVVSACGSPGSPESAIATLPAGPATATAGVVEGADASPESPATDGAEGCTTPYFPAIEGASWTYSSANAEFGAYDFTTTVTEVLENRFTLTSEFPDLTLTQHWECGPEGLISLELGGGTVARIVTGETQGELQTSNVSGVTVPASIAAGDVWSHSMDVKGEMSLAQGQLGSAEGTADTQFQAVGIEPVKVPAGEFEAMRVDSEFTLDLLVTVEGLTMPVTFTSSGSTWFVENLGWVKQSSTSTMMGIESTDTIELTSYSMP